MNITAKKWNRLSFFWQIYWFTVVLVAIIVAFVELFWEKLMEPVFICLFGVSTAEHETMLWSVCIFLISPLSGLIVSRFIEIKLRGLAENSEKLSRGDFSARAENPGGRNDAFGKVAAGFNSMAQKLESLFMMERRLLTDVSHELRSPLTRVSMALALAEENAGDEARLQLEFIENEVEKMNELVSLLLRQGRQSLMSTEKGLVDIKGLLESITAEASFEGKEKQKNVVCSASGNLNIHGNAIGLRTLFANIVNNALKYTPPGTIVEICAKRQEERILVEIRDYGPGVPESMLEDIFRAFFRVDGSRTRDTGGVGLGLAIAKQAACAHGGVITARNARPGLIVTISLPTRHRKIT